MASIVSSGTFTIVDVNDGTSSSLVQLFYSGGAAPALPTSVVYTVSTGLVTNIGTWSQTRPSTGSVPVWMTTYLFTIPTGVTTVTTNQNWTTAIIVAQNGLDSLNTIQAMMSNENQSIVADKDGVTGTFSDVHTMTVYNGTTDDSANWTYAKTNIDPNVTSALSGTLGNILTVTAFATASDTGSVEVTATRTAAAQVNILSGSETFDTTQGWSNAVTLGNTGVLVETSPIIAPNGTLTAKRITANAGLVLLYRKGYTFPASQYSVSTYVYVPTQAGINNWIVGNDFADAETAGGTVYTVFDKWVRFENTITTTLSRGFLDWNINMNGAALPAGTVFHVWGAMCKTGAASGMYIPYIAPISKKLNLTKAKAGATGPRGTSYNSLDIYFTSTSSTVPGTPTGGSYNFSTNTFNTAAIASVNLALTAGWSETRPASNLTGIYSSTFLFSTDTISNNVPAGTWSAPVLDQKDNVLYEATVYYQVSSPTAAAPSPSPTGGSYNFSTKVLTPPTSWLVDKPATTTSPTYRCQYTFMNNNIDSGSSTTQTAATWGTVRMEVVNGIAGANAITAVLSNGSSSVMEATNATFRYDGTATTLEVLEGATALTYSGFATASVAAGQWTVSTIAATGITANATAATGTGTTKASYGVASVITADAASILYTINGKTAGGTAFSTTATQRFTKQKDGLLAPSVSISTDRALIFTSTSGTIDTKNTTSSRNLDIVLTANTANMSGTKSYVWTFTGFSTAPATPASTSSTATILASDFGASKSATVSCSVTYNSIAYPSYPITINRVEKQNASTQGSSDPTALLPANPVAGDSYFNTTTNLLWVYNNSVWSKCLPELTSANIATFMPGAAIGELQVANGAITNLKIGNVIQSTDFTWTPSTSLGDGNCVGWKIDKTDGAYLTKLQIRTATGDLVMAAGGGIEYTTGIKDKPTSLAGINATEGSKLGGIANGATKNLVYNQATVPTSPNEGDVWYVSGALSGYVTGTVYIYKSSAWVPTADSTKSQLSGSGVNILDPRYCTFEEAALPPFSPHASGTLSQDATAKYFGTKSLKVVTTGTGGWWGVTGYTTNIQPNKKWIISGYVYSSTVIAAPVWGSAGVHLGIQTASIYYGTSGYDGNTLTIPANTWTRIYGILDLTADSNTTCFFRLDSHASGTTVWFDGIMLEAQIGDKTTPSIYQEPPNFLNTYIGALDATKNTIYRATSAPSGGTYTQGDLWFDTDSSPATFYQWDATLVTPAWSVVSNAVTNTNQVVDGAGLGTKAVWANVTDNNSTKPADNATVGATIGVNLGGQITLANSSTFIGAGAIEAVQISSLALVGNFSVKSTVVGARTEMDANGMKVIDANGIIRVQIGLLV